MASAVVFDAEGVVDADGAGVSMKLKLMARPRFSLGVCRRLLVARASFTLRKRSIKTTVDSESESLVGASLWRVVFVV
jgi:hypothetical protein